MANVQNQGDTVSRTSASTRPPNTVKKSMTLIVSCVGNISVVILIRTDTTLDHSQKAEKVWKMLVFT